jgi:hypothetical protein
MVAAGSTALIMSITARPAVATAVSASISTPVRSAVRTVAVMPTLVSPRSRARSTPCSAMGWHSGIRSGVRLAPMMPATRATASASPLGSASRRSSEMTSAVVCTVPAASADRTDTDLAETSTIRAAPDESTWVSWGRPSVSTGRGYASYHIRNPSVTECVRHCPLWAVAARAA